MQRRLLFVMALLGATLLSATNYYASPSGSSNGTSYQTPCSFANGVKKITHPGDTLFLLGGQYLFSSNQKISNLNGNASHLIVICNCPNEVPILDFRNEAYGERGLTISSSCTYLKVEGLEIGYSGKNGLYNEGSYCVFSRLKVYGNGDTGVQMKVGGHNTIINVDSYDNFDYKLDKSGNLTAVDFGGNADGFADKQHSGAPNTYIGCRAWNNSDDGWDFFQRASSGTTVLQNCICFENGPAQYDMRNHPRYPKDQAWFDQFSNGKTVRDDDGNSATVSLQHYINWGNGNGFKLGGDQTSHNVRLEHCLSVHNTVRGFDQNNNFGTMTLFNCSAYQNQAGDYVFSNRNGGNLTVRNCVSFQSGQSNKFSCTTTSDHNSWNTSSVSVSHADFVSLDMNEVLTARQPNGELPELAFMHLVASSDLIDKGVDVGLPFAGSAPDLGCYEYGAVTPAATLVCTTHNLTQSLCEGVALSPIVLEWGGSATGVTYSTLPAGLTAQLNNEQQTLTLSGTIASVGTYSLTVTTTGETAPKSLMVSITVKSASALSIAYLTTPDSPADELILAQLNNDPTWSLTVLDAAQTHAYDAYDLIIISPVPSSTAAGFGVVKGIDKPLLVLKPFLFKSTVWDWGTPQNTSLTSIRILDATHPLFQGLDATTLTLFASVEQNAVTCITQWNHSTVTELAQTTDGTGTCIAFAATGTSMNGTVLPAPMLMIGLSEYSTAHLTDDALLLLSNACHFLLGSEPTSALSTVASPVLIEQTGSEIRVQTDALQGLQLFTMSGQMVAQTASNRLATASLPSGLYLLGVRGKTTTFHKLIVH